MKILACNSNRPLAEAIAAYLDKPLTKAEIRRFADMEVFAEIQENVRGEDVFVIQSTSYPANDNLMELLVTLDILFQHRRGKEVVCGNIEKALNLIGVQIHGQHPVRTS